MHDDFQDSLVSDDSPDNVSDRSCTPEQDPHPDIGETLPAEFEDDFGLPDDHEPAAYGLSSLFSGLSHSLLESTSLYRSTQHLLRHTDIRIEVIHVRKRSNRFQCEPSAFLSLSYLLNPSQGNCERCSLSRRSFPLNCIRHSSKCRLRDRSRLSSSQRSYARRAEPRTVPGGPVLFLEANGGGLGS
jgi:hypothetical protein